MPYKLSRYATVAALLLRHRQVVTSSDVIRQFRLLGYPGPAMVLFIEAATGGMLLAVQILAHDRVRRRAPR